MTYNVFNGTLNLTQLQLSVRMIHMLDLLIKQQTLRRRYGSVVCNTNTD